MRAAYLRALDALRPHRRNPLRRAIRRAFSNLQDWLNYER